MRAKLKAWCTSHAHLLVFFGALIVFLTFVIKEGLGEYWRKTGEAIEMAQYFYSLHAGRALGGDNANKTSINLSNPYAPTKDTFYLEWSENIDNAVLDNMSKAQLTLSNLTILADKMPASTDYQRAISELEEETENIRKQLDELKPTQRQRAEDLHYDEKSADDNPSLLLREETLFNSAESLRKITEGMTTQLLHDAEDLRTKHERYADYAWRISWVLFSLGWCLGLLGKVYGVPDVASDE